MPMGLVSPMVVRRGVLVGGVTLTLALSHRGRGDSSARASPAWSLRSLAPPSLRERGGMDTRSTAPS